MTYGYLTTEQQTRDAQLRAGEAKRRPKPPPASPRRWLTVPRPEGIKTVSREEVLQGLAKARIVRDGEVIKLEVICANEAS